jgi:hypothetical protein
VQRERNEYKREAEEMACSLIWYFDHFEPSSSWINTSECT